MILLAQGVHGLQLLTHAIACVSARSNCWLHDDCTRETQQDELENGGQAMCAERQRGRASKRGGKRTCGWSGGEELQVAERDTGREAQDPAQLLCQELG